MKIVGVFFIILFYFKPMDGLVIKMNTSGFEVLNLVNKKNNNKKITYWQIL